MDAARISGTRYKACSDFRVCAKTGTNIFIIKTNSCAVVFDDLCVSGAGAAKVVVSRADIADITIANPLAPVVLDGTNSGGATAHAGWGARDDDQAVNGPTLIYAAFLAAGSTWLNPFHGQRFTLGIGHGLAVQIIPNKDEDEAVVTATWTEWGVTSGGRLDSPRR